MPGDPTRNRSVLSSLKPSLVQPAAAPPPAELERKLLGDTPEPERETVAIEPAPRMEGPGERRRGKVPTTPVTFHLPIELRNRIKLTAQAKGMTMTDFVIDALEIHLEKNAISEADVRRLLGLI